MPKPALLTVVAWSIRVAAIGIFAGLVAAMPHAAVFVELPQSPAYAFPYSATRELPAVFLLLAAWAASTALLRTVRGDAFGLTIARALKWIGAGMVLSAVAAIVVHPSVIFVLTNGISAPRGLFLLRTLATNLAGALVGLALLLLARRSPTP